MTIRPPATAGRLLCAALLYFAGALSAGVASAQGGPPPHVREAIQAVETMLSGNDEASLQAFAAERLTPAYRDSFEPAKLRAHLVALREAAKGALGTIRVEREADGLHLILSADREAEFLLNVEPGGQLSKLELLRSGGADTGPALTWDTLAPALSDAEAKGFSGVVLARRDGKDVLKQAYGFGDAAASRRTKLDEVYCIGSTPIDFTVTAILLLEQRGKLGLDDPIGKFLPDVPADRNAMTLRQLMTGKSGLPDFFHVDSVDWDPDLAWIDRDTAVARLLKAPLRFAPGAGQAHSHAAFVLLAAIVEIASGQPYRTFVRREILEPLGMKRTGFYGETLGLARDAYAVGQGPSSAGLPNIPPNWGPTSWLVMGSGGMFSTLDDMQRYYEGIAAGSLLTGARRDWQSKAGVDVGGSDRGYFILHASDGQGTRILLLTNADGRSADMRKLVRGLERLALPPPG